MVGHHPWQLSPGVSFASIVQVPNSKSVGHLLLVVDHPWVGGLVVVGNLDDHKISYVPNFNSVQNLWPLGSVEAYNVHNGIVRELGS